MGLLVDAEAAEKECCICFKTEEVGKLLDLVTTDTDVYVISQGLTGEGPLSL